MTEQTIEIDGITYTMKEPRWEEYMMAYASYTPSKKNLTEQGSKEEMMVHIGRYIMENFVVPSIPEAIQKNPKYAGKLFGIIMKGFIPLGEMGFLLK